MQTCVTRNALNAVVLQLKAKEEFFVTFNNTAFNSEEEERLIVSVATIVITMRGITNNACNNCDNQRNCASNNWEEGDTDVSGTSDYSLNS